MEFEKKEDVMLRILTKIYRWKETQFIVFCILAALTVTFLMVEEYHYITNESMFVVAFGVLLVLILLYFLVFSIYILMFTLYEIVQFLFGKHHIQYERKI